MAIGSADDRRAVSRELDRFEAPAHEPRVAVIAFDGSWFRVSPHPVRSLERRKQLRRILAALVVPYDSDPSLGLGVGAVFTAGWTDERCVAAALRNRVHVAIATLRALGLARVIVLDRGLYRLAPGFDIRRIRVLAP